MSNETKHTPEPWAVKPHKDDVDTAEIASASGLEIALCVAGDARRIVACVNACAGIGNETLEKRGVGGINISSAERLSFCQQRDELIAALRLAHEHLRLHRPHDYHEGQNVFDSSVAALAKLA